VHRTAQIQRTASLLNRGECKHYLLELQKRAKTPAPAIFQRNPSRSFAATYERRCKLRHVAGGSAIISRESDMSIAHYAEKNATMAGATELSLTLPACWRLSDTPMPKAQNCVRYEVDFLNQVELAAFRQADQTSRHSFNVVYVRVRSRSLADCAEKLSAAVPQFTDYQGVVRNGRQGRYHSWRHEIAGNPTFCRLIPHMSKSSRRKAFEWTCRSLTGQHMGTIGLRDGSVFAHGTPLCGNFIWIDRTLAARYFCPKRGV